MHTHIIYYATHNNKVIYIGSGLSSRFRHVTSGTSHVYGLNRLHFLEPETLKVEILKGFTSSEEALKEEQELVLKFKPEFNTHWLYNEERLSLDVSEIEEFKGDYIKVINEISERKVLSFYEAIESGLKPSVTNAVDYFEDEGTNNEVLYEVFPEFKTWIDSGVTTATMKTNRLNKDLIQALSDFKVSLELNRQSIKDILNLKIGEVYTRDELLKKVLKVYKDLGLPIDKAKPTDIKKWYKIKSHTVRTSSGVTSAYKIIKEL